MFKLIQGSILGLVFAMTGACLAQQGEGSVFALGEGGVVSGGGGKGVRCGDEISVLDLYEAEHVQKLVLGPDLGSVDRNSGHYGTAVFLSMMDSRTTAEQVTPEKVTGFVRHLVDQMIRIPRGLRLPPTEDATLPHIPGGCEIVQIAVYTENDEIYVDSDYWDRLSPQHQAALAVHELLYKLARDVGARTSDHARRVIGLAFSDQKLPPMFETIWDAERVIWCGAGSSDGSAEVFEFFAVDEVRSGKAGVGLYFRVAKDLFFVGRTSAFLAGVKLRDFEKLVVRGEIASVLTEDRWKIELRASKVQDVFELQVRAARPGRRMPEFSRGFCKYE